jgi:PKHD-type hydroxylase
MTIVNSHAWPFKVDEIHTFAYVQNFLSTDECKNIIKVGKEKNLEQASVFHKRDEKGQTNTITKNIRDSKVAWLGSQDLPNLFPRLTDAINDLNDKFFKFNLFGLEEGLQFTIYDGEGAKYGKHVDRCFGTKIRKLSITIELSDPSEREGGDLQLYTGEEPLINIPKEQGTLIAFPSFMLHEVSPIKKGTRYSLVAWITGENFK